MKSKTCLFLVLLASLLVSPFASLNAAQFVSSPPLAEVVKTTVGPVQEGGVQELPIITWGADIATIYANGNALSTVAKSDFAKEGLSFKLVRQDVFTKQLENYISGKTPYLRGTLGMVNMASELLAKDERTKPVIFFQHSWSNGGDCLVVREGIKTIADLKGKEIVLQAYGPHVELLATVLRSAGLKFSDVKIHWVKDLTGSTESPAEIFRKNPDIAACFAVSPDAFALTSNGTVGTGAEQSVKGARIMFSTRSANRVISDVYAVRSDYFKTHPNEVAKLAHALFTAQEELQQLVANSSSRKAENDKTFAVAGKILLDSEQGAADAKGLFGDCELAGYVGNVKFFATPTEIRRFEALTSEWQDAFIGMDLLSKKTALDQASFDYEAMKKGLSQTVQVEAPKFQVAEVAKVIDQKNRQGNDGAIYSLEILFAPNQNTFNAELYKEQFDKAIELAATYGGAILTVEGHSDPTSYVDKKAANSPELVLTRLRQSAKNLSLTRAIAVRESLLGYAKTKSVIMDPSQFAVVGHGFEQPKTGLKNGEPVRPKNQLEWASNMRVVFKLIPVGDTESSVFTPAGGDK